MNRSWLGLGLLLSLNVHPASAATAEAELKLQYSTRTQSVTLKELKAKLKPASLTVDDPNYKARKTFEGFWLRDVIALLGSIEGDELVFHCADGYAPTLPLAKLEGRQALLAFRDKGAKGGWQKLEQGKTLLSPAPYYLVWDTQDEGYPWPYQLVGIEVVRFSEKYGRIYPSGQARDSAVFKGFERFRMDCLRCHSLNLQGGDLGPELNVPKSVTEYWAEETLFRFIRDPGEFRARSKMPPFRHLKDGEIREVIEYLKWMRERKLPE